MDKYVTLVAYKLKGGGQAGGRTFISDLTAKASYLSLVGNVWNESCTNSSFHLIMTKCFLIFFKTIHKDIE